MIACFIISCGQSDHEEVETSNRSHKPNSAIASDSQQPLVIFAAASTTQVFERLAAVFEEQTGDQVHLSFASTARLAQQIRQGAKPDFFISANRAWMQDLIQRDFIQQKDCVALLQNQLVLIAPKSKQTSKSSVSTIHFNPKQSLVEQFTGPIAIADPELVPSGIYAKQAFNQLNWWEALKPRVLVTQNVRASLRWVEQGHVQLGVVYATDALGSNQVDVVWTIPEELHEPIIYTMGLIRPKSLNPNNPSQIDEQRDVIQNWILFLESKQARQIFEDAGFKPLLPGD